MSFNSGYLGQSNVTVANGIAGSMNPGVSPPDYTTTNHYQYHKMMGQNVRVAPVLLGMDAPIYDTPYPSRAQLNALNLQTTAEEYGVEEFKTL